MLLLSIAMAGSEAMAAKYTIQKKHDSVIGALTTTFSHNRDTLLDIARANGLGYQDIKLVNPEIDTWLPASGSEINLPLQFVLPDTPRDGIILNIPEMRLYYYPDKKAGDNAEIFTYPLGVGREGWSTPYMKTKIIEKKEKPKWHPPKSILKEHEEAGDPLPKVVEAGPDNPLGDYAMRLGRPEYLIHGTNKPFGIGMRVSHGCIRLYPEDIQQLFSDVKIGTRVEIVNQPFKVGKKDGVLYLEAHPFLEEDSETYKGLGPIVALVTAATEGDNFEINWDMVRKTARNPAGVPVPIGIRIEAPVDVETKEPEEVAEPVIQVAEVIDETESIPVDVEIVEAVKPEQKVVVPKRIMLRKRAAKKQENKLRLRMDTELNP